MTDKAPQQLQFIDTLPPQLRLALSRYKLRRSLNRPVSIEDDPDLQRLLELEKAWNASLPKTAATLPESAPPAPPANLLLFAPGGTTTNSTPDFQASPVKIPWPNLPRQQPKLTP